MSSARPHGLRPTRWDLLHGLLTAGVIAAVVLWLEHFSLMGWLDAAMLRTVAAAPAVRTAPGPQAAPSRQTPAVVLIDAEAYEQAFRLRSPLDREALRLGLSEVLAAQPKALLIDLQIELIADELRWRPLDELLSSAARAGTVVALPLPELRSAGLNRANLEWMRRLCESGVRFGSAALETRFGAVIRATTDAGTLAGAVQQPVGPGGRASPCELAKRADSLELVVHGASWFANEGRSAVPKPLQPSVLSEISAHRVPWRSEAIRPALERMAATQVVVGGSFDANDAFIAPGQIGPIPGAVIHATLAAGGTSAESHLMAWILDLALGTTAGLLFHVLWGVVRHAQRQPLGALRSAFVADDWRASRFGSFAMRSVWVGLLALIPWAITLSLAGALMGLSGALLEHGGIWLNPGPMIIGMALHTQLLSQAAEHAPAEHRVTLKDFISHHPLAPLQVVLALAALPVFFMH